MRFVEVRGRGEALTEPPDSAGQPTASRAIIRIRPTRILSLALSPEEQRMHPHEAPLRARDVGWDGYSIASISPRWNARGVAGNPYRSWCRVPEPHHPQRPTAS
ncbi:hypothetical protein GCM10009772_24930 [Pseudonocardia alni subsp. carboxydivorans]